MTWNLPSFTKASKVLGNLSSIMAGLRFEKEATVGDDESDPEEPVGRPSKLGPSTETPGGHHGDESEEEHDHDAALKPRYLDRLVQLELNHVILQIFKDVRSEEINHLKVIQISLLVNETIGEKHRVAMAKDRRQDLIKATGKPLTKRKANVETPSGITPGLTPGSGLFDFMTPTIAKREDTTAKRADTALVCVVNGHMLILRDKW
jgi:hypothetical protein